MQHTPNYGLTQYGSNGDKLSFIDDYSRDMKIIDLKMKALEDKIMRLEDKIMRLEAAQH
jgi:hypothetical protein